MNTYRSSTPNWRKPESPLRKITVCNYCTQQSKADGLTSEKIWHRRYNSTSAFEKSSPHRMGYCSRATELSSHPASDVKWSRKYITVTMALKDVSDGREKHSSYWPNMNGQIKDQISRCDICNTHRPNQQQEPLIPHEIATRPWAKVGIDLFDFERDIRHYGRLLQ